VDRDNIEDDNLGMFDSVIMPQLGEAVRKHPEILIAALIIANPIAFDGKALFADDHPCFDAAGSTYDNLEASAFALNAVNLAAIQAKAAAYKGEDGEPLEIRFTDLFVPPQLEFTAKQIMQSATYASLITGEGAGAVQIENVMQGSMNVHVVPKFSGAAGTWYAADLSKPVKPGIYQERRAPEFVSLDRPTDQEVFMQKKFLYGVEKRCAVGVSLPFLIHKAVT
jgi:phage major head subunit gpT-like protein